MSYLENLSCIELAEHYAKFHNQDALEELKKRDQTISWVDSCFSQGSTDNQMPLEISYEPADTSGVEAPWNEAYEAGFQAGYKAGEKSWQRAVMDEVK